MLDFINKKEYFEWLDQGIADPKNSTLKGIQDGWILSLLKNKKDLKIAEIGGGKSRVLKLISQSNECWNIDKLEGAGNGPTSVAEIPGAQLISSYMGEFDPIIPDNYFDVVFSISVVEHVPRSELKDFFLDCHRILKPSGVMLHAIDLYIFDEPSERIQIIDRYREIIDTQDFDWLVPPVIDGNATFQCRYASNPDTTLYAWNRVVPTLKTVREVSQSISIKMFTFKSSEKGQEAAQNFFLNTESNAEIEAPRQLESASNVTNLSKKIDKLTSTSDQLDNKRSSPISVKAPNDFSVEESPSNLALALFRRIFSYYSRWPFGIAVLAIALNIVTLLLDESLQWVCISSSTFLLLFLIGHAASKSDYVLEKLTEVEAEQQQEISALKSKLKKVIKASRRNK